MNQGLEAHQSAIVRSIPNPCTRASLTASLMLLAAILGIACSEARLKSEMKGKVEYLQPDGMHHNPAFSQVVSVEGPARTVYVGGQNAVNADGQIVGVGDIVKQAEQVAKNLRIAVEAGGAELEDVIQWNVYVVQGQTIGPAYAAFQDLFAGQLKAPPLVTVLYVAGLAHPDFLLEVSAIAVVPD